MAQDDSAAHRRSSTQSKPMAMTGRERRRRLWLLGILLALLALLAYSTYYFLQNRRLPLVDIQTAEVVQPPRYLYSITGAGKNELFTPTGVGVAKDGRVYVVDFGRRRVSIFTNDGTFIKAFKENLTSPVHLWVYEDEVWVTDRRQETIEIYTLDGEHVRTFEPEGETLDWGPLGIGFDSKGQFVVTDVGNTKKHRIHYFSAEGSRTLTVGRTAKADTLEDEPGGFSYPNGVAIAPDGRVYISDGDNRRVQVFSAAGAFEAFVDTSGIPRGIAIDSKRRLYVADAVAHTIDVYDLSGKRITQFGGRGIGPGQFNYPNDVAIDKRGRIYISDRENNQVQVWGWPVAEIPAGVVTPPKTASGWTLCAIPLLLLPLPFLFRKRRFVVTPDFITELVNQGEISSVSRKSRIRLVAPETDRAVYDGLTADGVTLSTLIRFQEYSLSDANALRERYGFGEREAMLLSMAERAVALCSQDAEQRQAGSVAEIRVMNADEFLDAFIRRRT